MVSNKQIRLKRQRNRIKQKDVAALAGISSSRLCSYELYGVPLPDGITPEFLSELMKQILKKREKHIL